MISMPDSISVASLPAGYEAYLGYIDGEFVTAARLKNRFPEANRVLLTVTGESLEADGCDCEAGDLTPGQAADWTAWKMRSDPEAYPVIYASASKMRDVIMTLGAEGIPRKKVRLLSAHYGTGAHICGPGSCAFPGVPEMDGTQWTNAYPLASGQKIDMSLLEPDFFTRTTGQPDNRTTTEAIVQQLPVLKQGATGPGVRTVQALANARGAILKIDGVFGVQTSSAVRDVQDDARIKVDGIVGPATWAALLGIQ